MSSCLAEVQRSSGRQHLAGALHISISTDGEEMLESVTFRCCNAELEVPESLVAVVNHSIAKEAGEN